MEYKYHIDDIVWVKIKGYPWWPGIVRHQIYNNILIQIKSIILNDNTSTKNKTNNILKLENQSYKYIIKFFVELTESIISDVKKIKPFLEYKNEFSKIKQKKLNNAIKFANIISMGKMSFSQHCTFLKEGIKSFEGQIKRLEEIKKEEEKEKQKTENEKYDKIIQENKENNNKDKIINKNINLENNNNNKKIYIQNEIKEKLNNGDKNNNKIIKENLIRKKFIIFGKKKSVLGRKRSDNSNSLRHHLMMDLIYSIDDFIYNKRNMKINDYDLFFKDIELKIPKNKLNTNGLNVSEYNF